MLTQKELKKCLSYDPMTGLFVWIKKPSRRVNIGANAGHLAEDGYVVIMIKRKPYMAHRLAWLYETGSWPKDKIDHKDHVKNNNAIYNLREATNGINSKNLSLNKTNKSGACGVSWRIDIEKWHPQIMDKGKRIHLGYFHSFFDAVCARKSAERKYGFHANHGS